jgi:hypothetical protein
MRELAPEVDDKLAGMSVAGVAQSQVTAVGTVEDCELMTVRRPGEIADEGRYVER